MPLNESPRCMPEMEFWDRPAVDVRMVALDFETTGSVPGWPVEPWQVGMVCLAEGRVEAHSTVEHLIRVADRPFSPHAPGRHERLRDDLKRAPSIMELLPEMSRFLLGRPLVAHNVGTERSLLRRIAPLHRFGPWIDTLRLVRRLYPQLPSGALEDVARNLGLEQRAAALCPGRAAHDALFDAVCSALVIEHLLQQSAWRGATVRQLMAA